MEQAYPAGKEFQTAIVWFRRDLRVDDNPALVAALNAAVNVIPVFIWAPEEEGQFQPGRCSRWWSKHSLVDLQQALAALGSRLVLRRSTDSAAALLQVVSEVGAQAVFFNHLYDPISLMRDHDCKRGLAAAGVSCRTFNGDMLYEPWEVLGHDGQPCSTFNDFWTCVRNMPIPPPFPVSAPAAMPPVPPDLPSMTVAEVDWFFTAEQEMSSDQLKFKWKPGVGGAISELERFLADRLALFEHDRAKMDRDSTSRLSPWIHIGSISVRYIFYRVRQCQGEWLAAGADKSVSCDDFLQQMGYREYSRYLAFHFPFIHERSLLRHLRACPWRIDQAAFKAWRQGQTGYPLVDAAMRQLWSSGWCHNRARVVAASFLVKDLLLPWQWGLKHYWDAQIDADLECDALGWQYVSGGMSDAHPFSYMMDLEKEAQRFDADGEYVRRWLPVLSRLPTEYIHAPWKAPPQVLAAADVELGSNYPMPVISRPDAKANVAYACSVLEKSQVATTSESSGRGPYRAPTYPQPQPHKAAGAGGSSGATTGPAGSHQQEASGHDTPAAARGGGGGAFRGGGGAAGLQPDSRTVSYANGSSGQQAVAPSPNLPSAPQSQVHNLQPHSHGAQLQAPSGTANGSTGGNGAAGPSADGAPRAGPPGGGVFYHPGDPGAGHELLERILRQQRMAREGVRQQDGSGTNNPPPLALPSAAVAGDGSPNAVAAAAAAAAMAAALQQAGPQAAWAAAAAAAAAEGEGEGEEGGWAQRQGIAGGPAAFAFGQAMQLLLGRRRRGARGPDGVSAIERGGGGRAALGDGDADGDGEDSEEVVSNTVDVNVTALTGASWHRQAGTARGAKRAAAGSPVGGRGDEEDEEDEAEEGEGVGSPTELGDEGREERRNVHKRHHHEGQLQQQQQRGGEEGGADEDGDMEMADQAEAQQRHLQGGQMGEERQHEKEGEEQNEAAPRVGVAPPYGVVDEGEGGDVCMDQQQPAVGVCGQSAHADKGLAHEGVGPMVGVMAQGDGAVDEELGEGEEEWGGASGSEDEADSGGSVGVEYRQAGKRGWGAANGGVEGDGAVQPDGMEEEAGGEAAGEDVGPGAVRRAAFAQAVPQHSQGGEAEDGEEDPERRRSRGPEGSLEWE